MSILPSDRAVKEYVGSWGEWMASAGVSWDDADYVDECEGCPVALSGGEEKKKSDTCWKEVCPFLEKVEDEEILGEKDAEDVNGKF